MLGRHGGQLMPLSKKVAETEYEAFSNTLDMKGNLDVRKNIRIKVFLFDNRLKVWGVRKQPNDKKSVE